MTVIAWDGHNLAWDSRATSGDRKHTVKKARSLKDGRVIVAAGVLSNLVQARKLLDGNGYPELPQSLVDATDIVIFDNGRVFAYDDAKEVRKVKAPEAWGSGEAYALGALECGVSAVQACKVACKHSATCGGKINSI